MRPALKEDLWLVHTMRAILLASTALHMAVSLLNHIPGKYSHILQTQLLSNICRMWSVFVMCVWRGESDNSFILIGKPAPTIQWFRDGVPVSETNEVPGSQGVKSHIAIGPLGRQDLSSKLSCKAFNHPRVVPVETTVIIDMSCE